MPDDGASQTSARISATACRLRRERLESLLARSPAVLYTCAVTPPFDTTFLSDNITAQLGYAPAQFAGDPDFWAGRIHPDDAPGVFENMGRLFERGQQVLEYRFRHGDGSWRWMRDEMRLVRDAAGRAVEIAGYWIDITGRKRAEESLRESESLFRSLGAFSPVGIVVNDKDGRAVYANPRLCQIAGLELPEIIGQGWARVLHPEDRPRVLEAWQAAVREAKEFSMEHRIVTPQGVERWVHGRAAPMRSDTGDLTGFVGTVADITERKRVEEELKRSRDQLRALSRRLAEAQEAERRRVAHELHDEIGQRLTSLKIVFDTLPQPPARAAQGKLRKASGQLGQLMEVVRNLSQSLSPAMLDNLGLLPALIEHFERFQHQTQIRVKFEHEGVEGRRFDPEVERAAYRIMQEALTNVARHAGKRQATVRLRADETTLRLEVEDRGRGFDAAAALAAGGSVGLHGMRERATALGGEWTIESAPGKGTRVVARLPLGREE